MTRGVLRGAVAACLAGWFCTAPAWAARYVVREGDSLQGLAHIYLGSYTRWPEIVFANPNLRVEPLRAGMVIEIPTGSKLTIIQELPVEWPEHWSSAPATALPTAEPLTRPTPLPSRTPEPVQSSPAVTPIPTSRPTPSPSSTPSLGQPEPVRAVRPLGSQLWISYQGWQYSESLTDLQVSASGPVTRSFQTQFLWRAIDFLLVDLAYDFSFYQTNRVATSEKASRQQDHVRLGALGVWSLIPDRLEWGLGANAEWENVAVFAPASGIVTSRDVDPFDLPHQRLGAALRTRLGYRPISTAAWVLSAEFGVAPFLAVQQSEALLPTSMLGIDAQLGTDFTLWGFGAQAAYFFRHHTGTNYAQTGHGLRAGLGVRF